MLEYEIGSMGGEYMLWHLTELFDEESWREKLLFCVVKNRSA
jgi:hypothetical protein